MYAVSFIPRPFPHPCALYLPPTSRFDPPLPEVQESIYFELQHAMEQTPRPRHHRQIHVQRDNSQRSLHSYHRQYMLEQPGVVEILMLPTTTLVLALDGEYPLNCLGFFWRDLDSVRWNKDLSFSRTFTQQL